MKMLEKVDFFETPPAEMCTLPISIFFTIIRFFLFYFYHFSDINPPLTLSLKPGGGVAPPEILCQIGIFETLETKCKFIKYTPLHVTKKMTPNSGREAFPK